MRKGTTQALRNNFAKHIKEIRATEKGTLRKIRAKRALAHLKRTSKEIDK